LLTAAGLQAEAIATYSGVRERLADELGANPGSELRAAYERALRSAATDSEREPAIVAAPPRQLPADLATFAGRDAEMAAALTLASPEGKATTVVISAIGGMAGVGKTALAIHWAHQVANQYPDGQRFIERWRRCSPPPRPDIQPQQATAPVTRTTPAPRTASAVATPFVSTLD